MKAKLTRYPNNEIRVSVYPEKFPSDPFRVDSSAISESTNEEKSIPDSLPVERPGLFSNRDEIAFNIKSKDDTPQRPRRWALSRNGRNQLLRAGACFDNTLQTERLLLTGTLPGSTIAAFRALAQFSTYASKTLTNWITRHNPGCKWEYAWEFQKRGALHIHLVIEVPLSVSSYVKVHFKDEWNRIIRAICSKSGTDLYAKRENYSHDPQKTQADVTVCDREPSRYISKYISKNATNSKGFSRFPPKTWYQISRSLLRALREKTQTWEREGLSYSQALAFMEEAKHNLSQCSAYGWRRFEGSVLAWSGYGYQPTFEITSWDNKMRNEKDYLMSTQALANFARSTMKTYPGGSCFVRAATHPQTLALMEKGMLSETELLMYIEAVIKTLESILNKEHCPNEAARFLIAANAWWSTRFGYQKISEIVLSSSHKICKGDLTENSTGTKIEPTNLFDVNGF